MKFSAAEEPQARPGAALRLPSIAPGGRTLHVRLADPSSSSSPSLTVPVDLLLRLAALPQNSSTLTLHVLLTRTRTSLSSYSARSPRAAQGGNSGQRTREREREREREAGVRRSPARQSEFIAGGVQRQEGGSVTSAGTGAGTREATVSVGGARPTRLRWALAPPLASWRLAITNRDTRRPADLLLTLLPSGTSSTAASSYSSLFLFMFVFS